MPKKQDDYTRRLQKVIHVGQFGEQPGGMAQVVNVYLRWSSDDLRIVGWRTTRGRRDPLSIFLTAATIVRLFYSRARRDSLLVIHLSQGGSWIREGVVLRIASALGWQCVAQIHGSIFADYASRNPRRVRSTLASSKSVYVLSDETQRALVEIIGQRDKIRRIKNIVEPQKPVQKENLIVFGGAVGLRKGADALFASWERAKPLLAGWKLSVAGPQESDFDAYALDGLEMHGAISNRALGTLLSRARVAILPSRAEAMPMFLLEAMSHGAVPISTDVGQVSELLHGVGVIVPTGDVEALTSALVSTCQDPDLEYLSQAARRRIRDEYSPETQGASLIEMWRADFAR